MQSTGGLNALACTQSGSSILYEYAHMHAHAPWPLLTLHVLWCTLCDFSVSSWTSLKSGIAGSSSGTWTLSGFSSNYNSEIAISGTVEIQGNGAILDAFTNGRFFNVGSGGSLTLQSLTLQNGKISGVGYFMYAAFVLALTVFY